MASTGTFLPTIAFAIGLTGITFAPLRAQSLNARSTSTQPAAAPTPDWEIAAGGKMAFDTATVRQNTTAPPKARSSTFPLGPGDVYISRGGFFGARNFPLYLYIFFAYKVTDNQEQFLDDQLPKWALTDRFDIEARKEGNPTKDQMRLMVRSLLADRFRLAAHHEIRQLPVYALLLDQPGKLGPLLQRHLNDAPCPATPIPPSPPPLGPPQALDARFPATCGGFVDMAPSAPGRIRAGAREVSMEFIASSLTGGLGGLDRPIWDRTDLTGRFDVAVEWVPPINGSSPLGPNFRPDPTGPSFVQALREQLGLRLEEQTGPVDVLVLDYVEPLPAN
jgi:uncharacterized protein (TIGR03435 family)